MLGKKGSILLKLENIDGVGLPVQEIARVDNATDDRSV